MREALLAAGIGAFLTHKRRSQNRSVVKIHRRSEENIAVCLKSLRDGQVSSAEDRPEQRCLPVAPLPSESVGIFDGILFDCDL